MFSLWSTGNDYWFFTATIRQANKKESNKESIWLTDALENSILSSRRRSGAKFISSIRKHLSITRNLILFDWFNYVFVRRKTSQSTVVRRRKVLTRDGWQTFEVMWICKIIFQDWNIWRSANAISITEGGGWFIRNLHRNLSRKIDCIIVFVHRLVRFMELSVQGIMAM